MFLGQETPSPSCTLYLSARSPIFIRLYLRLESVPLHFLLRSSSSTSSSSSSSCTLPISSFFFLLFLFFILFFCFSCVLLLVSPPGTDAATTTCKHSGICNSNAAKRGRGTTAKNFHSRSSPTSSPKAQPLAYTGSLILLARREISSASAAPKPLARSTRH